ncbi:MAG TPA: ATP-binding protein [Gemmatimonadaceae bacterium]|nr:ATP-binding protein [Gemmatimonadaceae bacterium]
MEKAGTFTALSESIEEPLLAVDSRGLIVSANEDAESSLSRDQHPLAGTPLHSLFWGAEPNAVDDLLRRGATMKARANLCFGIPGERVSEADVVIWPLDGPDGATMAVLVHDLTGLRRERESMVAELEAQRAELGENAREAARSAGELKTALEARHRFYASMSHELRTPVNAIVGYSELLLDGIYGDLTSTQSMILRRSLRAASHLQELVNDLLDLARIEEGRLDLRAEEVDVENLVEGILDSVQPLADARSLELRQESERDTPHIVSDPRRIRKILLHLLTNAIKYGGSGPITIRSGRASPMEGAESDGAYIEVSDHGAGIAPAELERIFNEFVKERDDGGGTGLGLSIARGLSHALGGTLIAESTLGEGSTFRLTLPDTLSDSVTDVELSLPLHTVKRHQRGRQPS